MPIILLRKTLHCTLHRIISRVHMTNHTDTQRLRKSSIALHKRIILPNCRILAHAKTFFRHAECCFADNRLIAISIRGDPIFNNELSNRLLLLVRIVISRDILTPLAVLGNNATILYIFNWFDNKCAR